MPREQELLDIIEQLENNDPTFKKYLIPALMECLNISLRRGLEYNGHGVPLMEHMFDEGDLTAYFNAKRPMARMKAAMRKFGENIPDSAIKDKIIDQVNYDIGWLCCRMERQDAMDSTRTHTPTEMVLHTNN